MDNTCYIITCFQYEAKENEDNPMPNTTKKPSIMKNRVPLNLFFLFTLFSGWLIGISYGCNIPVFYYALQNWPPDSYHLMVFAPDTLSPGNQELMEQIQSLHKKPAPEMAPPEAPQSMAMEQMGGGGARRRRARPPIIVELIPGISPMQQTQSNQNIPSMELHFPSPRIPGMGGMPQNVPPNDPPVWTETLNKKNVHALLDSPVRREIARRILLGDSAVWLFIRSGHGRQDSAARSLLEKELKSLEQTLKFPGTWAEKVRGERNMPQDPRIQFSIISMDRDDSDEKVLWNILVKRAPELITSQEPAVVPVFGCGRALKVLIGNQIEPAELQRIGEFLVGPCSCTVKEQNPGFDLLCTVDWKHFFDHPNLVQQELPSLSLAGMVSSLGGWKTMSPLMRNIIMAGVLCLIILSSMTWWMWKGKG